MKAGFTLYQIRNSQIEVLRDYLASKKRTSVRPNITLDNETFDCFIEKCTNTGKPNEALRKLVQPTVDEAIDMVIKQHRDAFIELERLDRVQPIPNCPDGRYRPRSNALGQKREPVKH